LAPPTAKQAPFHRIDYIKHLIHASLGNHAKLFEQQFVGPPPPMPLVVELQSTAISGYVTMPRGTEGDHRLLGFEAILVALPQACVAYLAQQWNAVVFGSYKRTDGAFVPQVDDKVGLVAKAHFLHGDQPFCVVDSVPVHSFQSQVYQVQMDERQNIEDAVKAYLWKDQSVHKTVRCQGWSLPHFGRDGAYHEIQFRMVATELSQCMPGMNFLQQAVNFLTLPQSPVPDDFAQKLHAKFRVGPESVRLIPTLNAPVSLNKRKRQGPVQLGHAGWAHLVRRWLDSDLSDTATAIAMGEELRKYAQR
jgi:hypothetical protein